MAPFVLAACGPGAPEVDHTSVQGSALGASFSAPDAVYATDQNGNVEVLVADDPELCAHLGDVGFLGRSEDIEDGVVQPSIFLVASNSSDAQQLENGVTAEVNPGGERVGVSAPGCTGSDGGVEACDPSVPAEQATVQIFQADPPSDPDAKATGSFELHIPDGGELTGQFRATPCLAVHETELAIGCSSASGFSLLPLLALLGLRRRRFTSRA